MRDKQQKLLDIYAKATESLNCICSLGNATFWVGKYTKDFTADYDSHEFPISCGDGVDLTDIEVAKEVERLTIYLDNIIQKVKQLLREHSNATK